MTPLNLQPAEKPEPRRPDGAVELVGEPWWTLQGEGPLAGTPAVFVRLAGCNLTCPRCDTDYTSRRRLWTPAEVVEAVRRAGDGVGPLPNVLVVITGGEPFRQNLATLCWELLENDYRVQIETNGTLPPSPNLPLSDDGGPSIEIVCSPKTPRVHPELALWAAAWKYVLSADAVDPHDGLPTDVLGSGLRPARPPLDGEPVDPADIFVQPLDEGDPEQNRRHQAAAVASCLKYGYRYSHQLHKLLGLA